MVEQLFSEGNIKKAGIKLNAVYFSSPKDTAADHKGFFTLRAENTAAIKVFRYEAR